MAQSVAAFHAVVRYPLESISQKGRACLLDCGGCACTGNQRLLGLTQQSKAAAAFVWVHHATGNLELITVQTWSMCEFVHGRPCSIHLRVQCSMHNDCNKYFCTSGALGYRFQVPKIPVQLADKICMFLAWIEAKFQELLHGCDVFAAPVR